MLRGSEQHKQQQQPKFKALFCLEIKPTIPGDPLPFAYRSHRMIMEFSNRSNALVSLGMLATGCHGYL